MDFPWFYRARFAPVGERLAQGLAQPLAEHGLLQSLGVRLWVLTPCVLRTDWSQNLVYVQKCLGRLNVCGGDATLVNQRVQASSAPYRGTSIMRNRPPPRTLPQSYAEGPTVVLGGWRGGIFL